MEQKTDLREILKYINPAGLNYQDWVNVGMALKHEGYPVEVWDEWSSGDPGRYHFGECAKKWRTFHGSADPVTAGSIVQMAKDNGWVPAYSAYALDWDDEISTAGLVIDSSWVEEREITEPKRWDPAGEVIRYLATLFEPEENVGYVTKAWKRSVDEDSGLRTPRSERWLPLRGNWGRTAGQLIEALKKSDGDIGAALGDYNPEAGAWIRFNPLDGKGCKNENVTEYRYALVESDAMDLGKQNALIRELELPVACMVFSGGKSIHAIVRIDAADYAEYRKRVEYLYAVCKHNGLIIDTQNKNPSRLSRLPGVMRNGKKQFIIDTNIGKASWQEWYEWIESVNDDLPDPETLADVWDNLPELSAPLIGNVLRQGHKMLLAGPSKAGKSFALIELCIAIAEGRRWIGFPCTKGRVLYVNLELDPASCLHRFRDVYRTLGWRPDCLSNLDIWNLRGKAIPMDQLAPKLIRRAQKKNYIAIVIDPIYKVITGDENSADQMAKFCNQFDKICTELNTAVIYCHHHSKGAQGGKRSMDRASGSGVFARDPDAMLDLIELEMTDELRRAEENKAVCAACVGYLDKHRSSWEDDLSQDDLCSKAQMLAYCREHLTTGEMQALQKLTDKAVQDAHSRTAWRIEGTLREFPKFAPVNLWFDYPVHQVDDSGVLGDIQPEADPRVKQAKMARKKQSEKMQKKKEDLYGAAIARFKFDHEDQYPTVKELYEELKDMAESEGNEDYPAQKTVYNSLRKMGYEVDKNTKKISPKQ